MKKQKEENDRIQIRMVRGAHHEQNVTSILHDAIIEDDVLLTYKKYLVVVVVVGAVITL